MSYNSLVWVARLANYAVEKGCFQARHFVGHVYISLLGYDLPKKGVGGEYLVLVQTLFNAMKLLDVMRQRVLGLLPDIYDGACMVVFRLIL